MKAAKVIDRLYNLSIKHWFITAIFLTLPSFWFGLIKFFGESFGFVDSGGKLTVTGVVITIALFAAILIFALIKSYKDKLASENSSNNQFVLERILSSINSACGKKGFRFIQYIKENNRAVHLQPFNEITQPQKQIADLLEEIRICLSEVLGINRDNIAVSLQYKYSCSVKWDWFHSINIDGGLTIHELISNPRTSSKQIIDGKEDLVYYMDKREGIENRRYVADKKDECHENIGSIICKKINVEIEDEKYVETILGIATYGKQMCDVKDENAQKTILGLILPPFEERIKLELALAYIKYVMTKSA